MKLQILKVPRHVAFTFIFLFLLPAALAQSNEKNLGEAPAPRPLQLAEQSHSARDTNASIASAGRHLEVAPPARTDADLQESLWKAYNAAVEYVSIWRNEDVKPLKPPTVAPDGKVEVATATPYKITSPLYGDTWVTIVPELRTICRQFRGDVAMQVRELLGLPPDHKIPDVAVMKVQRADIFRPTPDPTPWTICPCGNPTGGQCSFEPAAQCGNSFPRDVAPEHVQWIANISLSVRKMPGGFPWTHLGYTYNWKPGAEDSYGASEYVVLKGAEVSDIRTYTLADYCKP